MNRVENQVTDYPYYPDGPKRPISTGNLGQPEGTVTTIDGSDTPIGLTICRVVSIILSIVVVICFFTIYYIKI